ncbi:MAG: hypothetical protein DRN81_05515 [Thermoproteota archaeon]|nr:MAG: hypothetical protein DRN81_05515 [Candidatus Korarchaeota archaeon]
MKARIVLYHLFLQPMTAEEVRAEVVRAMREEHDGYYASHISGYTGHSAGPMHYTWTTSRGNKLSIRDQPNGLLEILVEGRRHGIPWRFVPQNIREKLDQTFRITGKPIFRTQNFGTIEYIETQREDLLPWDTVGDRPSQFGEA